jgi:uncharacterized protein YecE (DUF72 family)
LSDATGVPRIGTAGWSIPKAVADAFPAAGSHLTRYAARFSAVEINSSFYRPHRPTTYARWAASVPEDFRFSVKLPRSITHERKLEDVAEPLDQFLTEVGALGDRLGPMLIQLPPSLECEQAVAERFFTRMRECFDGALVCEPRHASWFEDRVEAMLAAFRVARVAADPAPVARAAEPGGWPDLVYRRLHGAPKIYYSGYAATELDCYAASMRDAEAAESWCIFDNTALGEATRNAPDLLAGCGRNN